jgi:hypothetical protein
MNPSTASIEQALLDVRKAYRLLHDYQRMVMDALNYVGSSWGSPTEAAGQSSVTQLPGQAKADWTIGLGIG